MGHLWGAQSPSLPTSFPHGLISCDFANFEHLLVRECTAPVRLNYSIVPRSCRICSCETVGDTFTNVAIKGRPEAQTANKPAFLTNITTHISSKTKHSVQSSRKRILIMEAPMLSAKTEFSVPEHHTSRGLSTPDPEARGRKRRRDPISFTFNRTESCTTFRGRCRHRSSSRLAIVSSRTNSSAGHSPSASSKRRLLGIIVLRPENHRRSQSPSRSRSPGMPETAVASASKRRRQRTQSRSRQHDRDGVFAPVSQAQKPPVGLVYLRAQDNPRST